MLPLHSPRLVLRRFADGDLERFVSYRNDPDVARYQSWSGCTLAEAGAFIERQKTEEPGVSGEWLQVAIALCDTNLLVGDCGLKVHASDPRQGTVGITLSPSGQRKGYATEALSTLFDGAFGSMRLHRIIADTDPLNIPSCRLMERLGMRREAHFRQSLWFKGRWADEFVYAVLREEWLAGRAARR
jgi:ribosomal-protein-alanine N-acetyltransferase